MPIKVSAVIHTFNSERYLAQCLRSISWCDEIIVVDMHSTDGTRAIASDYGAQIYLHENLGYADPARAFGKAKCTHDWVLAIDSDEIVPCMLATELVKLAETGDYDVIEISFRNFFFGKEILGSGWGYKNQVLPRFFNKKFLDYGSNVHDFITISKSARIKSLVSKELSIIHLNYDSVSHFISKLNRYTDHEIKKKLPNNYLKLRIGYHFCREVFGRFFLLRGYRDGWLGLYLSLAMAFYRATSLAKFNLPTEEAVICEYLRIAEAASSKTGGKKIS